MLCPTSITGLSRASNTAPTSEAKRSKVNGPRASVRSPIPARSSCTVSTSSLPSSAITPSQTYLASRNPWTKTRAAPPAPVRRNLTSVSPVRSVLMRLSPLPRSRRGPGRRPLPRVDGRPPRFPPVQTRHPAAFVGLEQARLERGEEHVVHQGVLGGQAADNRQRGGVDPAAFQIQVVPHVEPHYPAPDDVLVLVPDRDDAVHHALE